jgi:4-hydroxy-2-oxoheptanedioate aldolase
MNVDAIRAFRNALARGPVFGPFSKTCDPGMIEVLGLAGFDFVILDMEHGPSSVETCRSRWTWGSSSMRPGPWWPR